jgi:hypothetical protein
LCFLTRQSSIHIDNFTPVFVTVTVLVPVPSQLKLAVLTDIVGVGIGSKYNWIGIVNVQP